MAEAGEDDVEAYLAGLTAAGRRPSSVARALVSLRLLHRWCGSDAAVHLAGPEAAPADPNVLSEDEVASLLEAAGGATPTARRDRALLELLYGTGARISELLGLSLADVGEGVVRFGGQQSRVVPYGRPAAEALDAWRSPAGRQRMTGVQAGTGRTSPLFVNQRGGRLSRQWGWAVVHARGDRVGLGPRLGPHVLRHSFAVHLARRGAPRPLVQQLLVGSPRMLGPDELVEGCRRWHPRW